MFEIQVAIYQFIPYTIGMNKNTTVELTFSTNRFWELSMSDLGYTEGMTELEFTAKIADFLNNDDIEVEYYPETNKLKIYAE